MKVKPPRILIFSFSELVNDARLLKQIAGFAGDYDVVTCGYGEAPPGVSEHIQLSGAHPISAYSRSALIARRYDRAYWQNPAIREARELLHGRVFEVILANDVDPVGIALELRPLQGVHVDLHEYSPRQKENLLRWRIFVAPFISWMVKKFVAAANSWSTVSSGLAREYERQFGFQPEVVTNASPYAKLEPQKTHTPLRLVHSGAAIRDRKLEIMLDALELARADVTLDLFVTPNDQTYVQELRERAQRLQNVTVHDPVPYSELIDTLNGYDVGVFLLEPVNFSYRWALPNKLFDFVQARIGIIIGPSPEMVDVVAEFGLGSATRDFTPEALAEEIDKLTPEAVSQWKKNSHATARELSSEAQVERWRTSISRLVTR